MEMLDIFDSSGAHIGTKERAAVHAHGDWHKTFHCWIGFCDERGKPYVVLQQRSQHKASWPGRFDIAAAGHYRAGESTEDGLREVEEELGITVAMKDLTPLGRRVCIEDFGEKKNHELQDVFFLVGTRDLTAYKCDKEELAGIFLFSVEDLIKLYVGDQAEAYGEGLTVGDANVSTPSCMQVAVTKDSFIPSLDDYNLRALIQIRAALRGDKYLHI